jgi:hypothetical protein
MGTRSQGKGISLPLLQREGEFWVLKERDFTPEKAEGVLGLSNNKGISLRRRGREFGEWEFWVFLKIRDLPPEKGWMVRWWVLLVHCGPCQPLVPPTYVCLLSQLQAL